MHIILHQYLTKNIFIFILILYNILSLKDVSLYLNKVGILYIINVLLFIYNHRV